MANKLLTIVMIIATVLLTACSEMEDVQVEANGRTLGLFRDINKNNSIHIKTAFSSGRRLYDWYKEGDNTYLDYETENDSGIIILNKKEAYLLDKGKEKGTKTELTESIKDKMEEFTKDLNLIFEAGTSNVEFSGTKASIGGKSYSAEQTRYDDVTLIFAYEGSVRYILIKDGSATREYEIEEMSSVIPKNQFSVPRGYSLSEKKNIDVPGSTEDEEDGNDEVKEPKSLTRIKNEEAGISFKAPKKCKAKKGDDYILVYTKEKGEYPFFGVNVMPNNSSQSAKELLKSVAGVVKEENGDALLQEPKETETHIKMKKINGLEYTYTPSGETNPYVGRVYIKESNGIFYTWTAVCEKDDSFTITALKTAMETFKKEEVK